MALTDKERRPRCLLFEAADSDAAASASSNLEI